MIKKVIALFLVLLFSIESFAAVVSDNDGSAFITKAEFDSLKNNFQSQIDSYNTSIDSKIDGAIAAYLAGIELSTAPKNSWENLTASLGDDLWFANTVKVDNGDYKSDEGKAENKAQLFINAARHYTYKYSKFNFGFHAWSGGGMEFGVNPSSRQLPSNSWNNSVYKLWGKTASGNWSIYSSGLGDWGGAGNWVENDATNNINNVADTSSQNDDGEGSGWIYHKRADGKKILREYCSKICPGQILDAQWHTYLDKRVTNNWSHYTSKDGLSDKTTAADLSVEKSVEYGVKTEGTKRADGNTTADSKYWKRNQYKVSSSNTKDYSVIQWGKNINTQIYTFADNIKPTNDAESTVTIKKSEFNNLYFDSSGPQLSTNSLNGFNLKYYPLKFTPETNYLYDFINENISSAAGEIVYIGGGAPLLETTSTDQKLELTITFKVRDGGTHDSSSGTVKYVLSDKQFNKGAIASGAKEYASGTATAGTAVKLNFEVSSKSIIWINMSADKSGDEVTIDSFKIKVK